MSECRDIPTNQIVAGRNQRRVFKNIPRLAASIAANGQIEPILVRPIGGGLFEIVCGERRWRACKHAGIETVFAVVRELDDLQVRLIMLAENTGRDDLNPIEEAFAYQEVIDLDHTIEQVADIAGKTERHVRDIVKLLRLSAEIQHLVAHGNLEVNRALALTKLDHNRQRIVVRVHNKSPMTLKNFKAMCSELYGQQAQQSAIPDDLEAIWLAKVQELQGKKTKRRGKRAVVNVPKATGLPEIDIANTNSDMIYLWIQRLEEEGKHTEAAAVGLLYERLIHLNGMSLSEFHE